MLDVLRKNSKHWLVTIIIAVVIVGLTAFFGSASRSNTGAGAWAAKVGGTSIKLADFLTRYRTVVENYRRKLGPNFDEKILDALNIKMQLLKGMVTERIIAKEAEENGFGVSQKELVDDISKVPAFQKDGKFNLEYYNSLLSYNRMKPAEFEKMQKDELVREKMRDIIAMSAKVSEQELMAAYRMENEKIKLSFISVIKDEKSVDVKKEDIRAFLATAPGRKEAEEYYTKHNDEYKKDNKVIKYEDVKETIAKDILLKKKVADIFKTKVNEAVKTDNIAAAAKMLNVKTEETDLFTRKSPSLSKVSGSTVSDVMWAFNLVKGKLYKRDFAGRTYIFAVKEKTVFKQLDPKDKGFAEYKKDFLASRGRDEFRNYIEELDKRWAKKVVYSPAVIREERE